MKNSITSRRSFLADSAMTGIGLLAGSSLLQSFSSPQGRPVGTFFTGFEQTKLDYAYNSLEKAIDAQTMEIHYSKHAASYATNLQEAAKAEGVDMKRPLEEVLARISKYSTKMRNNGGGHYNHELFWKTMSPNGGDQPTGKLSDAINSSFNSFDSFKTQFSDAAKTRFGSGWAWLIIDGDKKLKIVSTPNQDNPLMEISDVRGFPVMGLDVWEHAYYLRYQNRRPDYINAWWNVVDWKFVQQRYESQL